MPPSVDSAPTATPLRRYLLRLGLPVLVGSLLFGWFVRRLDVAQLAMALRQIPLRSVVAIALLTTAATCCQGLRFALLCPAGISRWRHLGLAFALSAGNILLPFRGGEAIRPIYIRRFAPQTSLRSLVIWSVIDHLIEIACVLPLLVGAGLLFAADPRFGFLRRWVLPGGLLLLLLGLLVVLLRLRGLGRSLDSAGQGGLPFGRLGLAVGLSLLGWLGNYLIFYAVVPNLKLALLLLLAVSTALGLPALPAGVGPYEAAFLWVGGLGGLGPAVLAAAALVSHFVQILSSLLVGLPVLMIWGWPNRVGEVLRDPAQ